MSNIFDYLDWRADIPFSLDPFNEVDNLILSELAYTDFSGIVPSDGDAVPLSVCCEQFFLTHSKEDILKDTSLTAKAPLLMEKMLSGTRFGTIRLCRYINEIDAEKTAQLSGLAFLLSDGTAYIAFRGTDSSIVGWKEDFDLGYLTETTGQLYAVEYLQHTASHIDSPLRIGGHSKGGNFAIFASSFCGSQIQDRIITVFSNDGPGFRAEIVESEDYLRILPKIISIVPDTSIIGMILFNRAKHRVVKSNAFGILQHDGFSWSVQRNRFETTDLSELGKIFDQTLDSWVDGMDDETRKSFTETVFSIIESTGMDSFHEISKQKLKAAEAMLSSFFTMPKEKQSELLHLAGQLVQNGSQSAIKQIPEILFNRKDSQ